MGVPTLRFFSPYSRNDYARELGAPPIVVVSSDGASRGNPGLGSASACVTLVFEDSSMVVAVGACFLGADVTNIDAEFESACLARRLLIKWLYRAEFVC